MVENEYGLNAANIFYYAVCCFPPPTTWNVLSTRMQMHKNGSHQMSQEKICKCNNVNDTQ